MPDKKDNRDKQRHPDAIAENLTTYKVHTSPHLATKASPTVAEVLAHSLAPLRAIEDEFLGDELCFPRLGVAIDADNMKSRRPTRF
jgi:hypothetical protein